jgi:hypothetical protein
MHKRAAKFLPGLTVGIAWNGSGDPEPMLRLLEKLDYVKVSLLAPSNDEAAEHAIKLLPAYKKLSVLSSGDNGIYSAWNKLIFECKTRHICFHGIDDFSCNINWLSQFLETADDRTMIVLGVAITTNTGKILFTRFDEETDSPEFELGRHKAPVGPNIIFSANILREIGGADERFRIAGDVDMFFRARMLSTRIDSKTLFVNMTDGGMSAAARHSRTVYNENRIIARSHNQNVPLHRIIIASVFLNGRYIIYRMFGEKISNLLTDKIRFLCGRPARYSEN